MSAFTDSSRLARDSDTDVVALLKHVIAESATFAGVLPLLDVCVRAREEGKYVCARGLPDGEVLDATLRLHNPRRAQFDTTRLDTSRPKPCYE